jgi:hypothetical protein
MPPAGAIAGEALLEHAIAALRRASHTPAARQAAAVAAGAIEKARDRPLAAAVIGEDVEARVEFVNALLGVPLLRPASRRPGARVLAVTRGDRVVCRVHRADGSAEALGFEDAVDAPAGEVPQRRLALQRARDSLPPVLRQRPPVWAVWRWIARWIAGWRWRRRPEAAKLVDQVTDAERRLAAAEELEKKRRAEDRDLDPEVAGLRRLLDRAGRAPDAAWISIALDGGPPIALLDLPCSGDAAEIEIEIDGCLSVRDPARAASATAGMAEKIQYDLARIFAVTPRSGPSPAPAHNGVIELGGPAEVAARLRAVVAAERALRLARLAIEPLRTAWEVHREAVDRAEAGFAERLGRLEALDVRDPGGYVARRLAELRPEIIERVQQLIEQATVGVQGDLAGLAGRWRAAIAAADSNQALRAAVAAIEEEAPAMLGSVGQDARRLIDLGLRGSIHDLFPRVIAELRERSPALASARPPEIDPVSIGPSLARRELGLGSAAPRLMSLFKSVDDFKAAVTERLEERLTPIRNVIAAELLDAEPALDAALTERLSAALADAVGVHLRWVEEAVAAEQAKIDRERAELAVEVGRRDATRRDLDRLSELLAAVEAEVLG